VKILSSLANLRHESVDILIVGAGPAGLAAANNPQIGNQEILVIDMGSPLLMRDRNHPRDATCGDGGAGLFSDGKFSFFPSASELWLLDGESDLRNAYLWMSNVLSLRGMEVPAYPNAIGTENYANGSWHLKRYPSQYLSLENRYKLISELIEAGTGSLLHHTKVEAANQSHQDDGFDFMLQNLLTNESRWLSARVVIFAGGRFGSHDMRHFFFFRPMFRRLEVGFRIQQSTQRAFFATSGQLDPKYKLIDQQRKIEWRTFCACLDGEAILSETLGFWTISGRADCSPTGKSNIGFNTRFLDESFAHRVWLQLQRSLQSHNSHYSLSLPDVLAPDGQARRRFSTLMGIEVADAMIDGLRRLCERFPAIADHDSCLIGPTLEGVGWYPENDNQLKVPNVNAWVCGDACGKFRGIVAGLVSGHYAANHAGRYISARDMFLCSRATAGH
jgi:hypothetical protein